MCESLWVILVVENYFTISLGVLSSMLRGLWNLDAAESGQAWTQRQETQCQNFEALENSPKVRAPLKGLHLNTKTKPHQKSRKLQCWMPYANPSAKQDHTMNISKQDAQSHTKPIYIPKHTTGHGSVLQIDKIYIHLLEHWHRSHPTRKLHKELVQPHPWKADSTVKRNYDLPGCRKETQTE